MEVLETCMFGTDQKIGLVGGVGEDSVIDPEMFYTGPLKLGNFRNMHVWNRIEGRIGRGSRRE